MDADPNSSLERAVRRGLSAQEPPASSRRRFVVKSHSSPFRPGIDSAKLNRLADQLEAEDFVMLVFPAHHD